MGNREGRGRKMLIDKAADFRILTGHRLTKSVRFVIDIMIYM